MTLDDAYPRFQGHVIIRRLILYLHYEAKKIAPLSFLQ